MLAVQTSCVRRCLNLLLLDVSHCDVANNLALLEAAVFCESLVFDIFWLQENFCCVLQLLVSRIAFSHLGFSASGGSIYICLLLLYQLFRVCRQRPNSA